MDDNTDLGREPMPGRLKWVLVFVYFQVVVNLAVGIFVGMSIDDVVSHGEELANPGLAYFAEYGSYVAVVALLVAAVAITIGRSWGRTLLVVLEALAIVNGLITLISGTVAAVAGLGLAVAVIRTLFHDAVRSWFEHKEYLRNAESSGEHAQ